MPRPRKSIVPPSEIVWAVSLKFSDGFTRLWPSIGTVVAMGISMVFISFALRTIPMGTAYAVWTGIGAAGITLFGIMYFGEAGGVFRLSCIALIVGGIAGLKLTAAS